MEDSMDEFKRRRCPACERIARKIDEAVGAIARASAGEWQEAQRKAARALKDKRQHELQTGHSGRS